MLGVRTNAKKRTVGHNQTTNWTVLKSSFLGKSLYNTPERRARPWDLKYFDKLGFHFVFSNANLKCFTGRLNTTSAISATRCSWMHLSAVTKLWTKVTGTLYSNLCYVEPSKVTFTLVIQKWLALLATGNVLFNYLRPQCILPVHHLGLPTVSPWLTLTRATYYYDQICMVPPQSMLYGSTIAQKYMYAELTNISILLCKKKKTHNHQKTICISFATGL